MWFQFGFMVSTLRDEMGQNQPSCQTSGHCGFFSGEDLSSVCTNCVVGSQMGSVLKVHASVFTVLDDVPL